MSEMEGKLVSTGLKIAIIVTRFNQFVTERLLEGALDAFIRHGAKREDADIIRVPGAFELPLAAKKAAATGRYQAIVALGTVVRGETPHFEYVSGSATTGLASVMLESQVPIGFGLLTTETVEQAIDRAGAKAGNKGAEALTSAVEMANLLKEIK